jgi:hypothetical protein
MLSSETRTPDSGLAASIEAHQQKWGVALRAPQSAPIPDSTWREIHGDDPRAEAVRWLDSVSGGGPLPHTVCVIGAGLGYVVDAIAERSESRILVLEPEPSLVPWFFARRDWRPLINSGRLLVLAGPDFDGSQNAWRLFGDGSSEPLTLAHPVLARTSPAATRAAAQVIGRARQGARGNEDARKKFATPYLVNTLRNAARIARSSSVDVLTGRHPRTPIVLAAAGPSLNRNIEELRPFRDRVVLVAVDTALKPMLSAGMPPDFVVALDPSEANARHLTDITVPETTALVAEGSIAPRSFVAFGDRVFIFRVAEHAPWPWLRRMGIDRGMLRAWGSVVTSAFDLALRMGGDPVICIGTDLAYSGRQIYARGTTYEEDWRTTAGPDRPVEWVWENIIAHRSELATGIDGAEVPSAKGLIAFRDWLVEDSKRPNRPRLVNATGAGILFGGTFEQKSLKELGLESRVSNDPKRPAPHQTPGPQGPTLRLPDDPVDRHLLNVLMSTHDTPHAAASGHVMPFRKNPVRKRIASTLALRRRRASDLERWSESANLDPAWDRRAEIVGRFVPAGTHVLDVGAGLEALSRYIPDSCSYTPADLVQRSTRTIVADVNRGEFPDGEYDVIAALGLFEYVHDVRRLLATIHQRAPMLVTSYCVRTTTQPEPRLERGFVNDYTLNQFVDLCQSAGWVVRVADRIDIGPGFDQWVFALCRKA